MTIKAYLCVFICLVNLELTTNLIMESFLNCLSRFLSHRGQYREIYSNGWTLETNYTELYREFFLRKINNQFMISQSQKALIYHNMFHILVACKKAPLN